MPLAEVEKLWAKGEADLVGFLKDETGKSANANSRSYSRPNSIRSMPPGSAPPVRSDDALWRRSCRWPDSVRQDNVGYPVVIPKNSVYVTEGTDRRSSGTHYTPRSLTEPIVQYTLEPLVLRRPRRGQAEETSGKLKSAKELLELKICDMACGSRRQFLGASGPLHGRAADGSLGTV
jgi:hypothetical protein